MKEKREMEKYLWFGYDEASAGKAERERDLEERERRRWIAEPVSLRAQAMRDRPESTMRYSAN